MTFIIVIHPQDHSGVNGNAVVVDALKLLGLALLFILLGAMIETFNMVGKFVSIFIFYTIFIYIVTIAIAPKKDNR